ncbi:MAG: excinuclease ABC subunit UvrA, partial [Desulfobacteraceae bacterium]
GLSGSGKSSLAFDTIYAEGRRRYVESLSAYARQFLEQLEKPDVEAIEGLSPAVAIEQRSRNTNPRSTVATATEIHDYLRLLFARSGVPYCPQCGVEIRPQTTEEMVDRIMALRPGTRIQVLAPLAAQSRGSHKDLLSRLRRDGFTRVRVDGKIHLLEQDIPLDPKRPHEISVVVDRLVVGEKIRRRLTDSLELTLNLSGGSALIDVVGSDEILLNRKAVCPDCGLSLPDLTPQMFSFNNPKGACPACGGLGTKRDFDPELIVPDPGLSVIEGAIAPWGRRQSPYSRQTAEAVCRHYGVDPFTPFKDLPAVVREAFLYGSGKESISFKFEAENRRHQYERPFEGIIPNLERRYRETESEHIRGELEKYMSIRPCPDCKGARLNPAVLAVRVGGLGIHEVTALSVEEALRFFEALNLPSTHARIAERPLKEICRRLDFLRSVGLEYLTLDRASATLSGGEDQRIRLATQIGSSLAGVLYVLDEPSIGLHQRDNLRLLQNLRRLRDLGNTVLVVEHDLETIMASDHVIDMGPGAGVHGGKVVFEGPPGRLKEQAGTLTGEYISGIRSIPLPPSRRAGSGKKLSIQGARLNNLKDITVEIPLGTLTCVTGVSGSGKSSLVDGILYPALARELHGAGMKRPEVRSVAGIHHLDKVIYIDQSPIGRTPRSNPATYTGVFTPIRELFSSLPEAKVRGYKAGRFSFNVRGGRCEACNGEGVIKIEMHFLPDVYVTCEACGGLRFNRDTLEVRYRGENIAGVLGMTVNQAFSFFENIPAIRARLKALLDVGLGYITLGQSATTLSGGEAQRIKLARELGKRDTGNTLYLLDEPTTGLHFGDVQKLLEVLSHLVALGNTVVVIEHHLEVIKCADWVVDLGPEGGDQGGRVVACGAPEQVAECPESHTGRFLQRVLISAAASPGDTRGYPASP